MISDPGLACHHGQVEAARLLEQLPPAQIGAFLAGASASLNAEVIRHMTPAAAAAALERLEIASVAAVITAMQVQIAAVLIRRMSTTRQSAVMKELPAASTRVFERMLFYPKNSAGAVLNPNVFTLFDDHTVTV